MGNNIPFSQNYGQFESITIKPNAKKILLSNSIKLMLVLAIIISVVFLVRSNINFEDFSIVSETLDINFSPSKPIYYAAMLITVLFILLLSVSYSSGKRFSYILGEKSLEITKPFLMLFTKTTEIPYQNIVKLSFNNDGLFNTLFKTGTITLDLSAMKQKSMDLEFIDDTKQKAKYIQNLILRHKQIQQAQFNQRYRYDNIFDRYEEPI